MCCAVMDSAWMRALRILCASSLSEIEDRRDEKRDERRDERGEGLLENRGDTRGDVRGETLLDLART